MEKQIKIALAGNPNCGKTTLFNALTGSNQFVGNWPGVTVEKKEGKLKKHDDVVIMDLPGIYSLSPYTLEEVVARNYLITERPDAILNIIDGTNLERNLYLTTQLTELGIPVVIAINMMDIVRKNGDEINVKELSRELGCEIIEISALKGDGVMDAAEAAIRAAKVKYDLRRLKMISIGHTPQGFGFGRALDAEMMSTFGTTLDSIEARELINKAKGYTEDELADELAEARKTIVGLETIPENNVVNFARLYKAYKSYVGENHIGALCSRCWPDFFTEFGTPVCSVLSLLNANGVSASCESDAYGALSMFIGSDLTSRSCFFGDPVSMNEKDGTITFWHCGMAACDLARKDTGAQVGVHPNRKIGPVMDFGCEACEHVTIFRVGRKPDGSFRFFIAEGSALDKPKQFNGTSVVVKTVESAKDVVYGTVKGGWEPHFVVVYGQVANELEKLGNMLGVEVCKF